MAKLPKKISVSWFLGVCLLLGHFQLQPTAHANEYLIAETFDPEGRPLNLVYDSRHVNRRNLDRMRDILSRNNTAGMSDSQRATHMRRQCKRMMKGQGGFWAEFNEEMIGDNIGFLLASLLPFAHTYEKNPAALESQVQNSLLSPANYFMIGTAIVAQQGFVAGAKTMNLLANEFCNFHVSYRTVNGVRTPVITTRSNRVGNVLQRFAKNFFVFDSLGMAFGAGLGQVLVEAMQDKDLLKCVMPFQNEVGRVPMTPVPLARSDSERTQSCLAAHLRWTSPHKTAQILATFAGTTLASAPMYAVVKYGMSAANAGRRALTTCSAMSQMTPARRDRMLERLSQTSLGASGAQQLAQCSQVVGAAGRAVRPLRMHVRSIFSFVDRSTFGVAGRTVSITGKIIGGIGSGASYIACGRFLPGGAGRACGIVGEVVASAVFFVVMDPAMKLANDWLQPIFKENGHEEILRDMRNMTENLSQLDNGQFGPEYGQSIMPRVSGRGRDTNTTFERRVLKYGSWNKDWRTHIFSKINEIYMGYRQAFDATLQQWAGARQFYQAVIRFGENSKNAKLADDFGFVATTLPVPACSGNRDRLDETQKLRCVAEDRLTYLVSDAQDFRDLIESIKQEASETKNYFSLKEKTLTDVEQAQTALGNPANLSEAETSRLQAEVEPFTGQYAQALTDLRAEVLLGNVIKEKMDLIINASCYVRRANSKLSYCTDSDLTTAAGIQTVRRTYRTFAPVQNLSPLATDSDQQHNKKVMRALAQTLAMLLNANSGVGDRFTTQYNYFGPPTGGALVMLGMRPDAMEDVSNFWVSRRYPKTYEYNLFTSNPYYKLLELFGYPYRLRAPFYLVEAKMIEANTDWLSKEGFSRDNDWSSSGQPWDGIERQYDYLVASLFCGVDFDWKKNYSASEISDVRRRVMDESFITWGPIDIGGGNRGFRPPKMYDNDTIGLTDICSSKRFFSQQGGAPEDRGLFSMFNPVDMIGDLARGNMFAWTYGQNLRDEELSQSLFGVTADGILLPISKRRTQIRHTSIWGHNNQFFDISDLAVKGLPKDLVLKPELFEEQWDRTIDAPILAHLSEKNQVYRDQISSEMEKINPIWESAELIRDPRSGMHLPRSENMRGLYASSHEELSNLSYFTRKLFLHLAGRQKVPSVTFLGATLNIANRNTLAQVNCEVAMREFQTLTSANEFFEVLLLRRFCSLEELVKFVDKKRVKSDRNDDPLTDEKFGQLVKQVISRQLGEMVTQSQKYNTFIGEGYNKIKDLNQYRNGFGFLDRFRDSIQKVAVEGPLLLQSFESQSQNLQILADPRKNYYTMGLLGISIRNTMDLLFLGELFNIMIDNSNLNKVARSVYRSMAHALVQGLSRSFYDVYEKDEIFKAVYRERRSVEATLRVQEGTPLPWETSDDLSSTLSLFYGVTTQFEGFLRDVIEQGLYLNCEELIIRKAFYSVELDRDLAIRICSKEAEAAERQFDSGELALKYSRYSSDIRGSVLVRGGQLPESLR